MNIRPQFLMMRMLNFWLSRDRRLVDELRDNRFLVAVELATASVEQDVDIDDYDDDIVTADDSVELDIIAEDVPQLRRSQRIAAATALQPQLRRSLRLALMPRVSYVGMC